MAQQAAPGPDKPAWSLPWDLSPTWHLSPAPQGEWPRCPPLSAAGPALQAHSSLLGKVCPGRGPECAEALGPADGVPDCDLHRAQLGSAAGSARSALVQ